MTKMFPNRYEDYTEKNAKYVLVGKYQVHMKFREAEEYIWRDNIVKYSYLDHNDNSVYTGTAGVSLLYLLKEPTFPESLQEAKNLLHLGNPKGRTVTFLCGDAGPLAIGIILNHKLGLKDEAAQLTEKLIAIGKAVTSPNSDMPNELLYGRCGYLFALMFVTAHLGRKVFPDTLLRGVVEAVLEAGKQEARSSGSRSPLMYSWHGKRYLGAAHGLVGILHVLLEAREFVTDAELKELVRPTLDYLLGQRHSTGNLRSSVGSDTDRLVQWCHGAPGLVHLLCLAFEVFNDQRYLEVAKECGEQIWQRGLLRKGYSLCHGVSGNGYSFLRLFRTTKDPKYLYRACRFADWCIDKRPEHEEHRPDRPLSLYEGCSGVNYFLADLLEPDNARFPGFELPS